jgi:hypothetical protein
MYQWKKFQFFEKELVKEANSDAPHQLIKKLEITCSSSGRGNLIFGDANGFLNMVDRDFKVYSFPAYRGAVSHVEQLKQSNILVTVGSDDEGITPTLKVWNLEKADKTGNPLCLRSLRIVPPNANTPVAVTAVAVLEDLSQVAIGLVNGVVLLIRDLAQERTPRLVPLSHPGAIPITGLGFAVNKRQGVITLFVATTNSVVSYRTSHKNAMEILDDNGCELGCAVLGNERDFSVGRKEAVYFYEQEGRGPCFAFEGDKKLLAYFRSYLIVVSQDGTGQSKNQMFNIYDLKNKFIAFTDTFPNVSQIISEWGSIFVLTQEGLLFQLVEKDTQTKLETLFKKNLYPIAIELAQSQQYDYNSIIDIFRKYGDHLYGKGDYDGAMRQYLRTIGRLEPSYVIRKFLDAQRIHNLTSYLQALHEQGLANADHTTLLFNCYTKLKDVRKLDEFVRTEANLTFDVGTAIKVCRQAGYYDHAFYLAQRYNQHDAALKILIEDRRNYDAALQYIATLSFADCEKNLKQNGKSLMACLPEQTTKLLMELCTAYKPRGLPEDMGGMGSMRPKAKAEEFIHIFVNQPEWLTKFLEYIVTQGGAGNLIYNTLLELYLREDDDVGTSSGLPVPPRQERLQKAADLLRDSRAQFDEDHALVLAQMHDFKEGILILYEKLGLYNEIVEHYMEENDYTKVIAHCKKYGVQEPSVWIKALTYFARKEEDCRAEIGEVLSNIDRDNLLPPLLVIQILAQKPTATLDVVREYIGRRLEHENNRIAEDQRLIKTYSEETARMQQELQELRTSAKIFQNNKCSSCTGSLDLPAVHFLCMHSFHQRCLGEERECPLCSRNNRKILEIKRALEESASQHEQFFKQLEASPDGFATVAEYFGRGLFNEKK